MALPAVLVFEDGAYLQGLAAHANLRASIELIHCPLPRSCASLDSATRRRVLAVVGNPRNASLLQTLPRLRLVQSTSYFHPHPDEVPRRAVIAQYSPDWRNVYGVEPIAEWVLAAAFDWAYNLRSRAASFRSCAWGEDAPRRCASDTSLTRHPTLMGQTMGVLGYGAIGQAVASRAAALGMRTVATRRHGPFTPAPSGLAWLSSDNDRLLREADVIALTVPGSTIGLINETSLRLMKPSALLIPVSAGPVDFAALSAALARGEIGGASIDTWPSGCWRFPETHCGPPWGEAAQPYDAAARLQSMSSAMPLPSMSMRDERFWAASAQFVAMNLGALVRDGHVQGLVRNGTGTAAEQSQRESDNHNGMPSFSTSTV